MHVGRLKANFILICCFIYAFYFIYDYSFIYFVYKSKVFKISCQLFNIELYENTNMDLRKKSPHLYPLSTNPIICEGLFLKIDHGNVMHNAVRRMNLA